MTISDWTGFSLITSDAQVLHGEPVFVGTRIPAMTILENVDAYLDEGLPLDEAIRETLVNFPSLPNGARGVLSLLEYRTAQSRRLSA